MKRGYVRQACRKTPQHGLIAVDCQLSSLIDQLAKVQGYARYSGVTVMLLVSGLITDVAWVVHSTLCVPLCTVQYVHYKVLLVKAAQRACMWLWWPITGVTYG